MLRALGRLIDERRIPVARVPQMLDEIKSFFAESGVDDAQATVCAQMLYVHLLGEDLNDLQKVGYAIPFFEEFLENVERLTGWSPKRSP